MLSKKELSELNAKLNEHEQIVKDNKKKDKIFKQTAAKHDKIAKENNKIRDFPKKLKEYQANTFVLKADVTRLWKENKDTQKQCDKWDTRITEETYQMRLQKLNKLREFSKHPDSIYNTWNKIIKDSYNKIKKINEILELLDWEFKNHCIHENSVGDKLNKAHEIKTFGKFSFCSVCRASETNCIYCTYTYGGNGGNGHGGCNTCCGKNYDYWDKY